MAGRMMKNTPRKLETIDFGPLVKVLERAVFDAAACGYSSDIELWTFSTAMECVFGDEVWSWWRRHVKDEQWK